MKGGAETRGQPDNPRPPVHHPKSDRPPPYVAGACRKPESENPKNAIHHHLYRRLGPRKSRTRRLRRRAPLGPSPQGALARFPPDDQQPHGAHGRLRRPRSTPFRRFRRRDLLRLEICRRCRLERLGVRLGAQGIRRKEEPRPLDALPPLLQPAPRPLRLGQGSRRHRREQPLRPVGRRRRQRPDPLARRYRIYAGIEGGVWERRPAGRRTHPRLDPPSCGNSRFSHLSSIHCPNFRAFFAFRVIIPIFAGN